MRNIAHFAFAAVSLDDFEDGYTQRLKDFLLLRDYTTRWALLGTLALGISAGVVGTFLLLRKRALVGDVVSHSALPGVAIAFLVMELHTPGEGRWLPGLLIGAAASGALGVSCMAVIRRFTRLKEDAVLAIVLGVFYGVGVSIFSVVERLPFGHLGGLEQFTFGAVHSILAEDVRWIAGASFVVLTVCGLLFKEFALLCFDPDFARAEGWPVALLDLALMALVVAVAVIGMQSAGLLLVVAMLITPAAAARFWTESIHRMAGIAAIVGGLGAFGGVLASHLVPKLTAGATIVLAGSACFVVSLLFGARRGLVWRVIEHRRLARRVRRDHLLRACYEALEVRPVEERASRTAGTSVSTAANSMLRNKPIPFDRVLAMRTWSPRRLERKFADAEREGLAKRGADGAWRLTVSGADAAVRAVRNHRLWELYLIHHADTAPGRVDLHADLIEHVLDPEIIAELEHLLAERNPGPAEIPESPHELSMSSVANR